MNSKRIAFGIGIVLAVLVAFTAPAAADSSAYFVPQHGNGSTGDIVPITLYADIEEGKDLATAQATINYDRDHANIVYVDLNEMSCDTSPTGPDQYCWGSGPQVNYDSTGNGSMWGFVHNPKRSVWVSFPPPGHWTWESIQYIGIEGPETVEILRYWVEADGTSGVSPFDFGFETMPDYCPLCQESGLFNYSAKKLPTTWENGTFTHEGEIPSETYEKELVSGWNLISLPLTASDMTIGSVFNSVGGSYSGEIYSYDAEANTFVVLTGTDVLANGVGYFISMNSADTWTYEGWNYTDMTVSLEQGLNMIGGLNCTKDIEDALSSIEGKYRYVSRWDTQAQKYEVYVPGAPSGLNDFDTMDRGKGYFISMKVGGKAISEEC